ncbi:unnamed protein product [Amoebophrya sp. A120]|nr:unnamed protein product [Amoebophrya sp. A120]|eukprot:GSA120T00017030001.1
MCQNCGIYDKRAVQLCFLFLDVDNSEQVFAREILTAFHIKRQLAPGGSEKSSSSRKRQGQTNRARQMIAESLGKQFAGCFAKADLLKRVVKAPWSASEQEAVQGGFKTLKRIQTGIPVPKPKRKDEDEDAPPPKPGFRRRRKLAPSSENAPAPAQSTMSSSEPYLGKVEALPAELLHSDLIFNLEEYARSKNVIQKQHTSLITECGSRDMLELYFLGNKLRT